MQRATAIQGQYAVRGSAVVSLHPEYGYSAAHAILVDGGYYNEPQALYCPAWTGDLLVGDGDSSLWQDPQALLQTSYHYRTTFNALDAPNTVSEWRSANFDIDPGDEPFMSDAFSDFVKNRSVPAHHVNGLQVSYLDGSVRFHQDYEGEDIRTTYGDNFHVRREGYVLQERVWTEKFRDEE
ncbi:MAG: H-X9-DG-CTERM domain-containing protein [Planctomycetota bacterium]